MTARRVTPEDRNHILALVNDGESYRAIAADTGWSVGAVAQVVNANRTPGVRLTDAQRAKLGAAVVQWADDNKVSVLGMRDRMRASGAWSSPPTDTAILLALAEHVHAELVAQTGGVHPTMRAALYRMMGVYGAAKKLYGALGGATARARKRGALPRDFWLESDPLDNPAPGWWTATSALYGRLRPINRPSLALRDTGLVAGVVVEAAGQAPGVESALAHRIGYRLPVWPTGGTASLPRIDYIADEMAEWAERNNADTAVIYVITDFDPSGMVIAANIEEQAPVTFPGLRVQRLGIDPLLTANVVSAGATGEELSGTHVKSAPWLAACGDYGIADPTDADQCFQAEALDYTTWATIIADQLATDLAGRPVNTRGHAPEFVNADRVVGAVARMLGESPDLADLADLLEALEES